MTATHEQADADMGRAPAVGGDEMLHHRRPDRAGEIIAGGGDRDRDAAPAREPMRDVGHQRPEGRRAAEADQALRDARPARDSARQSDAEIAEAQRQRAEQQRRGDAEAVGEPSHDDAAAGKADHGQRIGQRRGGAVDAEIGLDRRQGHHHRPHADAADGRDRQRHAQPPPGVGRVDSGGGAARCCIHDVGTRLGSGGGSMLIRGVATRRGIPSPPSRDERI